MRPKTFFLVLFAFCFTGILVLSACSQAKPGPSAGPPSPAAATMPAEATAPGDQIATEGSEDDEATSRGGIAIGGKTPSPAKTPMKAPTKIVFRDPVVAGSSVTISGTGVANSFVNIYFTCQFTCGKPLVGRVKADGKGVWTHTFKVPADVVSGPTTIMYGCDTCSSLSVAGPTIRLVTPLLGNTGKAMHYGDMIHIEGKAKPLGSVTFSLAGPSQSENRTLGRATADNKGNYVLDAPVPNMAFPGQKELKFCDHCSEGWIYTMPSPALDLGPIVEPTAFAGGKLRFAGTAPAQLSLKFFLTCEKGCGEQFLGEVKANEGRYTLNKDLWDTIPEGDTTLRFGCDPCDVQWADRGMESFWATAPGPKIVPLIPYSVKIGTSGGNSDIIAVAQHNYGVAVIEDANAGSFVHLYDLGGNELWSKRIGDKGSASALASSATGRIFVAGSRPTIQPGRGYISGDKFGRRKGVVVALNENGDYVGKEWGIGAEERETRLTAITVDSNDKVYVGGYTTYIPGKFATLNDSSGASDQISSPFVGWYSGWSNTPGPSGFYSPGLRTGRINSVAIYPGGSLIIGGTGWSPAWTETSTEQAFVYRLQPEAGRMTAWDFFNYGVVQGSPGTAEVTSMWVDSQGDDILVAGKTSAPGGAFVRRYFAASDRFSLLWDKRLGTDTETPTGLMVEKGLQAYVEVVGTQGASSWDQAVNYYPGDLLFPIQRPVGEVHGALKIWHVKESRGKYYEYMVGRLSGYGFLRRY